MIAFFHKIVDVLNENKIPYMLSGSVAMSVYVLPRATWDFDFIVHLLPEHVEAFTNNFQEGYYCDKDAVKEAVFHRSLFNIIDYDSGYKAGFVILKNNIFRQMEFNRKQKMDYFGKAIYIASPGDLLLSKLIWIQDLQSAIQMDDIKNISEIKSLDWHYIYDWVKKLQLNTFKLI